jgi:hypothetical protein
MCLVGEKVNNIPEGACRPFVKFAVSAMGTGNYGEFFILDVKDFGKCSAGGPDLVHFVLLIAAFRADVFLLFHVHSYLCKIQKRNIFLKTYPYTPPGRGTKGIPF